MHRRKVYLVNLFSLVNFNKVNLVKKKKGRKKVKQSRYLMYLELWE